MGGGVAELVELSLCTAGSVVLPGLSGTLTTGVSAIVPLAGVICGTADGVRVTAGAAGGKGCEGVVCMGEGFIGGAGTTPPDVSGVGTS